MVQRFPNSLVKIFSAVILTLIPLIISIIAVSTVFDSSNIELTVLEKLNHTSQESQLEILVQNTGSQSSTDLILFLDSQQRYDITKFKTTDTMPKISEDEQFRVEIPRLAPQSYVIIHALGNAEPINKDVWVTTNDETEVITIPAIGVDLGVSSVDLKRDRNFVHLTVFVFGIVTLLSFRYYNFYKSENTRRQFLGTYDIPLVRFNSVNLVGGVVILMIGFGVASILDFFVQPELIDNYLPYGYFELSDTISMDNFYQTSSNTYDFLSWGIFLLILSYLPMHIFANHDIKIPNFIWSLPRSPEKILLTEIESSFIPSETVAINTTKKISDINSEIIMVTENNEIIGLISKKVVEKSKIKDGSKLKTVFTETKRSTNKKSLKIDRNNFVVILHTKTLAELKEEMEKNHKKYAIIANEKNEGIGVVSYDDLFGEPRIFQ